MIEDIKVRQLSIILTLKNFPNQLIFIDELVEQQYSAIVEKFSDDLNLKNIVILCENKNFEISKHKI